MSSPSVLIIGLLPELVDMSEFPGLTPEKVRAGISAQVDRLVGAGYAAQSIYVDRGETAEVVLRSMLALQKFDCVLISAGMRVPDATLLLFEKIINVVHEVIPNGKICFNTGPDDAFEAVKRWV